MRKPPDGLRRSVEEIRTGLRDDLKADPLLWGFYAALAVCAVLVGVAVGILISVVIPALWFTPWWVKAGIVALAYVAYRLVRWVRR